MAQTARIFFDIDSSIGNYISDIDGNRYLDAFRFGDLQNSFMKNRLCYKTYNLLNLHGAHPFDCQISSATLGYNHPVMLEAARSPDLVKFMANRPAMGFFPHS